MENKKVEYLVADTTAFVQNAPLQEVAENIITCPEVVNEVTSKRQIRRLVVLPYNLIVKEVFPENIKIVTDFSKKTGDYPSLSATDIKVIALTYQLEIERVGSDHLRTEPVIQKALVTTCTSVPDMNPDITGFYIPGKTKKTDFSRSKESVTLEKEINELSLKNQSHPEDTKFKSHSDSENNLSKDDEACKEETCDDENNGGNHSDENNDSSVDENEDDDDAGWITPSNVVLAKKQVNSELMDDRHVAVACMTTDFAMQNVLKQMNLNVAALDGRLIKKLRTYILRCYSCFKTTSVMTKRFCPACGNDTLKKVAFSLDENGKMVIHINTKKPLTARGKKFSLPKVRGGKHPNNPILVEDQPMPDNKPSRLAKTKNNPLDDDYIAGFSPFIMRDVTSKSAQLCIRPGQEMKHWMRRNPNEARRRKK